MSERKIKFQRHYLVLAGILLISAVLNFYKLGQEGYGNSYYSAAVRSMLDNWHNFFFNSFDPKGFITIDKPPVDFWFQTLSAYIFGFKGWSLFFPQALAGVLSTALLYHLVARVFGRGAGLLASLFLALTPIVVAADRTNEVDSLLMFVTLIATWAISKAAEQHSLKWLVTAFCLVGVGFNIKMMEAFLVLPAFYLFYWISVQLKWTQKMVHLVCATAILAVVSLSWSVIVDSIPANQRPYVGSTQDNSMVELAIGYNGINRLVGQHGGGITGNVWAQHSQNGQNGTGAANRIRPAQNSSIFGQQRIGNRPFNMGNGFSGYGQTGKSGLLRLFTTPELDGQLSWLLPLVFFSAISLLWGMRLGLPLNRQRQAAVLWSMWVLTMFIFFSIASRFSSYYMVMMAPGIAALAGAGLKKMWDLWKAGKWKQAWLLPVALVCTATLDITVVWKYPSIGIPLSISIAVLALLALFGLHAVKKVKGLAVAALVICVLSLTAAPAVWAITPIEYGGSVTKPFAGPELKNQHGRDGMRLDPKLENYLESNYQPGTYLLATMNANTAAPIILDTGLPVMAMGGFMGNDPALSAEKLQSLASQGQIHFFLIEGRSFGNQQRDILNWIQNNCKIVPSSKWQNTFTAPARNQVRMGFGNPSSMTLYEYVKK